MKKEKTFLGKQLKDFMYEKRITQQQLAAKLGVDQTMISHWITGARNPNLNTLKRLSSALDIPFNMFLEKLGIVNPEQADQINSDTCGSNQNTNLKIELLEEKMKRFELEISLLKKDNEMLKKALTNPK